MNNILDQNLVLKGKKVLLRVDLNVPVRDGKVLDDTRILSITSTLQYLRKQQSKIVLI